MFEKKMVKKITLSQISDFLASQMFLYWKWLSIRAYNAARFQFNSLSMYLYVCMLSIWTFSIFWFCMCLCLCVSITFSFRIAQTHMENRTASISTMVWRLCLYIHKTFNVIKLAGSVAQIHSFHSCLRFYFICICG